MTQKFGIDELFDHIFKRPYDFEDLKKPDPKVAFQAMKEISLSKSNQIYMVGDSSIDMEFAKNSGLIAVALFNNNDGCDYFFNDFISLRNHLNI